MFLAAAAIAAGAACTTNEQATPTKDAELPALPHDTHSFAQPEEANQSEAPGMRGLCWTQHSRLNEEQALVARKLVPGGFPKFEFVQGHFEDVRGRVRFSCPIARRDRLCNSKAMVAIRELAPAMCETMAKKLP